MKGVQAGGYIPTMHCFTIRDLKKFVEGHTVIPITIWYFEEISGQRRLRKHGPTHAHTLRDLKLKY